MPNGGYTNKNGASLCSACHIKAEGWLNGERLDEKYSPVSLYAAIGSSYDDALRASGALSNE